MTTSLVVTDKAAAEVRPTYEVDAIAEIRSYAAYAGFSERLRRCGFREDTSEGAPICRWRQKKTILDVMPLDEKILGFSNRWYKPAMDSSVVHELEPDLRVRVVTAVYFCATKLEAFTGRGKGDYQSSHDLEDLFAVVDGRAESQRTPHLDRRMSVHTLPRRSGTTRDQGVSRRITRLSAHRHREPEPHLDIA